MPLESQKKVRFCLEKEEQDLGAAEHTVLEQPPVISREELATHTSAEDCWLAIHGAVYDVSRYLTQHPGGAQVMLKLAGKDATAQFDDVGHSMESLMFDLGSGACVGVLKARPVTTALSTPQNNSRPQSSLPSTAHTGSNYGPGLSMCRRPLWASGTLNGPLASCDREPPVSTRATQKSAVNSTL